VIWRAAKVDRDVDRALTRTLRTSHTLASFARARRSGRRTAARTPSAFGDVVSSIEYDAFGLRRTAADGSGVSVTFTGHEADPDHALINTGGRRRRARAPLIETRFE
jgi:hypothetical protein